MTKNKKNKKKFFSQDQSSNFRLAWNFVMWYWHVVTCDVTLLQHYPYLSKICSILHFEKVCVVFTHALRDRVGNNIPVSPITPQLRLALGLAVQFPHDGAELRIRNWCILEERQHRSLVRFYELSVLHVGAVTLSPKQNECIFFIRLEIWFRKRKW